MITQMNRTGTMYEYNLKALAFVRAVQAVLGLTGSEVAFVAGYTRGHYANWLKFPAKKRFNYSSYAADCYVNAAQTLYEHRHPGNDDDAICCAIFAAFVAYAREYYIRKTLTENYLSDEYLSSGLNYIQNTMLGGNMGAFEKTVHYIFGGIN